MEKSGLSNVRLHIYLFGFPTLQWHEGTHLTLESNKVRALFFYLLLHLNLPQPRDYLAYLLWPDVPAHRSRKNLRQALYNLRQALGPLADPCLDIQRDTVILREHPGLWADVWEFQQMAETVQHHAHRPYGACPYCATRYAKMVDLYRGEFLQGFTLKDAGPVEEWIAEQRRHYHQLIQKGVHLLLRYYHLSGQYGQVEQLARWWIKQEPWDDAGYAYLMRALAHQERKGEAFRVYHQYADHMEKELGVSVPAEAQHLLYEIQEDLLPEPESVRQGRRLPIPNLPLIGREREYDVLLSLLSHPKTRLVTLTGPGGSGKTRLAQEVARGALTLFPDGVYWVRLGNAASEQALRAELQEALEQEWGMENWYTQWLRWAEGKRALLVLDDVDDLVDVLAERLPPLLMQAPHLVLLLTSRRALQIRQEHRFPLRGLPFPADDDRVTGLEEALAYPAVEMFVERARRLMPLFRPEGEELQALIRILQLSRGLPLAIELAAAQAVQDTCREVLARLEQACLDLAGLYRDLPEHHRSLRALIQASWGHLPDGQRLALSQLALFQGPFDEVLAGEVAGVSRRELQALVDASLLDMEEHELLGRFWVFHPFIREFALDKLQSSPGTYQEVERRARRWIAHALEQVGMVFGRERARWLRRLHTLQDAVDAFLNDVLQEPDAAALYPLLLGMTIWFSHYGLYQDGWRYLTMLESRLNAQAASEQPEVRRTLARILHRRARIALQMSEMQSATRDVERALALLEDEEPKGEDYGWSLQILSSVRQFQGHLDEAETLEKRALDIFRALRQTIDQANALNNLGGIAFYRGDMDTAARYFEEALKIYRENEAFVFMLNTLGNLSMVELTRQRITEARRKCEEALRIAQQVNAQISLTFSWLNLGIIAITEGETLIAYRHLRRAERIARRIGNREFLIDILTNQGIALRDMGRHDEARNRFEEALALARETQASFALTNALYLYAQLLISQESFERARKLLIQALEIALEHRFTNLQGHVLHTMAQYWHATGARDKACALLEWLRERNPTPELRDKVVETLHQFKCPKQRRKKASDEMDVADWLRMLKEEMSSVRRR